MIKQLGFKPTNKPKEILPAGELVILDTDQICNLQDLTVPLDRCICYKYEQRYQRENKKNEKKDESR